ncbi:hypothetical protein [Bailinhaonella thermotolerans]|uniref:Uncharacterized protein n=1 Tax=Bailinhaonella thermotolerans TaxID=1070861 RepID=A0A3A4AZ63_9ACTN|nr:hypothetical protein [Bailinhaonella thermotolerans]RJL35972.1 hypothetical protein D5H75_04195 [Bailinhaonella thermotolerans]
MTGYTARVEARCGDCGGTKVRQVNQYVQHGRLRWDAEFSCDSCGSGGCEGFGTDPAPEDIRRALLVRHGPSRLRIAGPLPSLVPALKALRETLGVSLPRARELVARLTDGGLTGTLAEMEYLQIRLHIRGVPSEVTPVTPGPSC